MAAVRIETRGGKAAMGGGGDRKGTLFARSHGRSPVISARKGGTTQEKTDETGFWDSCYEPLTLTQCLKEERKLGKKKRQQSPVAAKRGESKGL